jgi:hypothetical protein
VCVDLGEMYNRVFGHPIVRVLLFLLLLGALIGGILIGSIAMIICRKTSLIRHSKCSIQTSHVQSKITFLSSFRICMYVCMQFLRCFSSLASSLWWWEPSPIESNQTMKMVSAIHLRENVLRVFRFSIRIDRSIM